MKTIEKLTAQITKGADPGKEVMPQVVRYSHVRYNGIVRSCVVAIADDGVWYYISTMMYHSLQHEVYALLNGVEYEDYLEYSDHADARYPEPSPEDLTRFFCDHRHLFLPLTDIIGGGGNGGSQASQAPQESPTPSAAAKTGLFANQTQSRN